MSNHRLKKKGHYVLVLILGSIAGLCVWLGFVLADKANLDILEYAQDKEHVALQTDAEKFQKIVDNTRARSVFVYDIKNNKTIASKNSLQVRSLASLTKLVTASLVYESYKATSSKRRILPEIQHMLTTSSNDEAQQLAFSFSSSLEGQVARMNAYTKPYGLTFRNVSGLDIILDDGVSRQPSSQGNAESIGHFAADTYLKYPEFFDTTIRSAENTNTSTNDLSFMLGGKTGFTDLAGGNLMVIVQKGISHPYVIVVLGSTENGRFVDVEHIARALLQLNI